MSVLIKGMKMPKDCWNCPLLNSEPCPCKGYSTALEHVMNRHEQCPLVEIPAADVAPVVHGRWEHGREVSREYTGSVITNIFYEKWNCSACGYTIDDRWYSAITYNYCPNCGAKMGKEENT